MNTKLAHSDPAPSWAPVRRSCQLLCERAPQFAPEFAALIRAELPAYVAVPWDEHVEHVREQCVLVLRAVADRRRPNADELDVARQLGMRRASQNLNVQTVIGAFQLGNRELWNKIRSGPATIEPLLPEVGEIMWDAILIVTGALAAAHAEVSRALQADRITLQNRFVELLDSADFASAELTQIARVLGFDPGGTFQAVAANTVEVGPDRLGAVGHTIGHTSGTSVCAAKGTRLVIVGQGVPTDRLVRAFAAPKARKPLCALGVGLKRIGLAGAALSVADAVLALGAASGQHRVSRFEENWLPSIVLAQSATLRALVERQLPTVAANAVLRDTVEAFAEQNLSVARTAGVLQLHPNSVLYRLTRWEQLTGWDARSFHGLTTSLLACWIHEFSSTALPLDA